MRLRTDSPLRASGLGIDWFGTIALSSAVPVAAVPGNSTCEQTAGLRSAYRAWIIFQG